VVNNRRRLRGDDIGHRVSGRAVVWLILPLVRSFLAPGSLCLLSGHLGDILLWARLVNVALNRRMSLCDSEVPSSSNNEVAKVVWCQQFFTFHLLSITYRVNSSIGTDIVRVI